MTDNDPLTLTCSGNTNINVTITGLQVSFQLFALNWYGVETITFSVFDGIDQSSDIVTINVLLNITTGVVVDSDNLPLPGQLTTLLITLLSPLL